MKSGGGEMNTSTSTHRYTSAQVKFVLTFCAYGIANVVNCSTYSVVLKKKDAYSLALKQYFDCESTGAEFEKSCDRSAFKALDTTPITFPLTTIDLIHTPTISYPRIRGQC